MRLSITATADLHGELPDVTAFSGGDVLIIAGDIAPDAFMAPVVKADVVVPAKAEQQSAWFMTAFMDWAQPVLQKYDHIVMTAGNHDKFAETQGGLNKDAVNFWRWYNTAHQQKRGNRVHFLLNDGVIINGFRFHCFPFCTPIDHPAFNAFSKSEAEIAELLKAGIASAKIDIIVSHQPPLAVSPAGHNIAQEGKSVFYSKSITQWVEDNKPAVVVCGHIHGGYGRGTTAASRIPCVNVAYMDAAYTPVNPAVNLVVEKEGSTFLVEFP